MSGVDPSALSTPPVAPFSIGSWGTSVLVLRVVDPWDHNFFMLLNKTVTQAPGFYPYAPVIFDLEPLAHLEPFNLAEFIRRVRQHLLVPVGVINAQDAWQKVAITAGLSIFPVSGISDITAADKPKVRSLLAGPSLAPPHIVTETIRSGQQIHAPNSDLIVLASVSHGAELVAGGSIHIYGPLRGRAMAGVSGMPEARIFCHGLDAELISIDGAYMVADQIPQEFLRQKVQIWLGNEMLMIEPLQYQG